MTGPNYICCYIHWNEFECSLLTLIWLQLILFINDCFCWLLGASALVLALLFLSNFPECFHSFSTLLHKRCLEILFIIYISFANGFCGKATQFLWFQERKEGGRKKRNEMERYENKQVMQPTSEIGLFNLHKVSAGIWFLNLRPFFSFKLLMNGLGILKLE